MTPLQIAHCLIVLCCVAGCTRASRPAVRAGTYEDAAQLSAMPSCKLKVEAISPCAARLRAEDGTLLYVGSPGASPQVVRFVHTLEEGKTYVFPAVFTEYRKQHLNGPVETDTGDG